MSIIQSANKEGTIQEMLGLLCQALPDEHGETTSTVLVTVACKAGREAS